MEKKSYSEILAIVQEHIEDVDMFAYGDFDEQELGLGPIKEVASGGGEDEGSRWFSVKHFVDHDVYIKVTGYYQSHHGTEFYNGWDECSQVNPQSRNITVYE